MKIFTKIVLLSFLFSASFCDLFGQQVEKKDKKDKALRLLVRGGFDFGGDKVAEIDFEDGSKQSVPAGNGGWIAIGAEYQVPASYRGQTDEKYSASSIGVSLTFAFPKR